MEALNALVVILILGMGLLVVSTTVVLLIVRGLYRAAANLMKNIVWGHRLK